MDGLDHDSADGTSSSSSTVELLTTGRNNVINASPTTNTGNRYGRTSISSGSAHLGDTHIVNNYFRTPPISDTSLRVPSDQRPRRHSGSRERSRKWFVPRASTPYFTGRRIQLRQLKLDLSPDIISDVLIRKIVIVVGLGGSGKTQFCLKFAEETFQTYWGVFWIDASSQETAELGWSDIGSTFGRGPSAAAGKFWLSQIQQPWLLVLDNADSDYLDIASLLPSGINGHVIITTRRNSIQEYATAGTVRLDKMDPDEAISLLLNAAYSEEDLQKSRPQSRSIAQTIAHKLDYLAIALHQAGKTIRCKICTLEKYLATYTGHRLRPPGLNTISTEIISTWEIPFQKLEQRTSTSHQDAVAVFHLLAFLHHQPVHEFVLKATWSTAGEDLKPNIELPKLLQGSLAELSRSQSQLRHAFSILYDHSIVEFNADSGICIVHPVIHEWARYRITEQGSTPYWLTCTLYVLACASREVQRLSNEFTFNFLLPHMDSFLIYAGQVNPALFQSRFGANCAEAMASAYERAASWHKAIQLLETVVTYRMATSGSRHEDTLRAKRNMSMCHWNLFQVDRTITLQNEIWVARWWSRRSLFDWCHPYRPQHAEYGMALSDLTQSLWLAGRLTLSKRAGERAVHILQKRLGEHDTRTVDAVFNLARTYRHLDISQQAHSMLVEVRRRRIATLGVDHPDTLMVRNEVAMNLCGMRRHLGPAERMVRNVLYARERILGVEHAYTLWSVNDLSKVLCVRGRFHDAIALLEGIIPAVSRTLGDQHVGMHMTKGNLARALAYADRWTETEEVLKEMLADENLGVKDRMGCLRGLSRIQMRMGKLEDAKISCNNLLMISGNEKALHEAAGLLREIHIRQDNDEEARAIQLKYPSLVAGLLNQPFELI